MSAVARRYAKALFALAKEAGTLAAVADELGRTAAVTVNPEVHAVLGSPLLAPAQRLELARSVASEAHASDLLTRFLSLLAEHPRLAQLLSIHQHFQELLDRDLGRVRVTIRSATPLSPKQEADVIATFTRVIGKQVLATVVVDPDLLGGIVVEAEGKVYDGSVRTQLTRLAKDLTGTAL